MFKKPSVSCLAAAIALAAMSEATAQELATKEVTREFYQEAKQMRDAARSNRASCLACHGRPDIVDRWRTSVGGSLGLHVDPVQYGRSVHRDQDCRSCHLGEGKGAFETVPHRFETKVAVDCESCHGDYFKDIVDQVARSHHTKAIANKGKDFPCYSCHDAHAFRLPKRPEDIRENIIAANAHCIRCHHDLRGYEALTDRKLLDQNIAHWFLPHRERHFEAVRCVDCHGGNKGAERHVIVEVGEGDKANCTYCHARPSALVTQLNRYRQEESAFSMIGRGLFDDESIADTNASAMAARAGRSDSELGFMNTRLFDRKYIVGATYTSRLNIAFVLLLGTILAMVLIHVLVRAFGVKAAIEGGEEVSTIPLLIRVWHWINAFLFVVLMVSGFSMHFASGVGFEMGRAIHVVFAVLLPAPWILYVTYLAISGELRQYAPRPDFLSGGFAQLRYYLYGIYHGLKNPSGHDPDRRLNPLQQIFYNAMIFVIIPVLILTGVGLYFPELTPGTIFGFPGERVMALIHSTSSFLSAGFLVIHVYLCTTGESSLALFRSMVTGKKRRA